MTIQQILRKQIKVIRRVIKLLQRQISLLKPEKDFSAFAKALGKRESGNNYKAVNTLGYLGRWQFGMARLCDLGYTVRIPGTIGFSNKNFKWEAAHSKSMFLHNPNLQDLVFKKHVENHLKNIDRLYKKYFKTKKHGILITRSGILGGAHLGGIQGVGRFLERGYDSHDQFGTKISDYVREFGGYNLSEII